MLVLSRRVGERVIIDKKHTLKILRLMRDKTGYRMCVIQHDGPHEKLGCYYLNKAGEMHINDEISFKILSIARSVMRMGISAPAHVSVHRDEIQLRIDQEAWQKEQGDTMGMRND